MDDCVFCKIVKGEIPSARVYEDAAAVAFLDIQPFAKGHTLVVPRHHVATLAEMDPAELATLITIVQRIAAAVTRATGAQGFNLLQNNGACAGQTIPHVHFHIVPRHPHLPADWIPDGGRYADGEMAGLAARIREGT